MSKGTERGVVSGVPWEPTDAEISATLHLLDKLQEARRLRAVADAMEVDALAEASRIAWAQVGRAESDSRFVFPMRSMAGEIAAAVHESKGRTQARMSDAYVLAERFPATVEALREGRITLRHADVIRRVGEDLPAEVWGLFEGALLPVAEEVSPGVLRDFATRVAEELHPRSFRERHQDALKRRTVWSEDLPDGLAELHVVGDAVKIHAVRDRLQRMARAYTRYVRAQERQREREQAAQQEHADREQREGEQTQRERAERERAEREQSERERAEREQAERERAEREQAEREQGQAEREPEQGEPERSDGERAAQQPAERAEAEHEQSEQEREERESFEREEPERGASEQAGSGGAQAGSPSSEAQRSAGRDPQGANSSASSGPWGSSDTSEPSGPADAGNGAGPGVDRWWLNVSEEDEKLFGELLEASCAGNGGRLRGTATQPDTRYGMGSRRGDGADSLGGMNGTHPPAPFVGGPSDGAPSEAWPDDGPPFLEAADVIGGLAELEEWLRSAQDRPLEEFADGRSWPPDDIDPADVDHDDPDDPDESDVIAGMAEDLWRQSAGGHTWDASDERDLGVGAGPVPGADERLARAVSEPAELERVAVYRQRAEAWADERNRAQVASDMALELLLTGTVDAHSRMNGEDLALGAIHGSIQVTVPATTLAGVDDTTAFLTGNGPVDPDTARRLAREEPGWDRLFLHPDTGALETVDRYTPTPAQKRFLRARDEVCRTPGCENLAAHADLDHTIPYSQGGNTHVSNLEALCPGCHQDKHHTPWTVRQIRPGVLEWTSPAGRRYVDHPLPQVRFGIVNSASNAASAAAQSKRDDKRKRDDEKSDGKDS
ncbi:DUF222 domain-containing protein [Microbacterium oryzae]|uniref:HNH endonuclease signature motif containing protein n=1 Tax=Microbacterium oryzae TaxID=743009 RepID=UPI0025B09D24|nr:HNH endonuclease signature motif containing protein [Microbacterium oryzae]MDN3311290.1 DUF222 domain-containing protein [Microbacterium oryzae]